MHESLVVFAKEVLDNFRDRRTLMSALVFGPLLGPLVFAGMVTLMLQLNLSDLDKPLELAVAGQEHAPNLVQFLRQHNVDVQEAPGDPEAAIEAGELAIVLVIPESYPEDFRAGWPASLQLVADHSNNRSAKTIGRARRLLEGYRSQIAGQRLALRGVSPLAVQPLLIEDWDVSSAAARGLLVLGSITYFLIIAVLIGGLYLAIDTTAGERERSSLESLLTLPVARSKLVLGKLSATSFYMLLSLCLALIAFVFTIPMIPLDRLGMVSNFSPLVALKILLVMLPFIVFGATLLTIVATFTKSYKEAQSYLSALMLVPSLPIIIASLYTLQPELRMMLVPSLSQHLLVTELMKGVPLDPLFVTVSMLSTLALGVLLGWLAILRYQRESILG